MRPAPSLRGVTDGAGREELAPLCRLALDYYEAWVRNPDVHREPVSEPLPFRDGRIGEP